MKAVLCKTYGPPESLVVEEVPALKPGAGEAVVAVKAAGVNFPDVLIIQNKYQVKPPLPFSPGSEVAGIVTGVGDGVNGVKLGDPVMAFTTFQSTAPWRSWVRRLAKEPASIAASEVPMAMCITYCGAKPWCVYMSASDETMMMPPPMPSSPAKKPTTAPIAR